MRTVASNSFLEKAKKCRIEYTTHKRTGCPSPYLNEIVFSCELFLQLFSCEKKVHQMKWDKRREQRKRQKEENRSLNRGILYGVYRLLHSNLETGAFNFIYFQIFIRTPKLKVNCKYCFPFVNEERKSEVRRDERHGNIDKPLDFTLFFVIVISIHLLLI